MHGPVPQADLLASLGIGVRLESLLRNAPDGTTAEQLRSGYARSVHSDSSIRRGCANTNVPPLVQTVDVCLWNEVNRRLKCSILVHTGGICLRAPSSVLRLLCNEWRFARRPLGTGPAPNATDALCLVCRLMGTEDGESPDGAISGNSANAAFSQGGGMG